MSVRVLQIGADRSKRGIHVLGSPAFNRQKAYAERFGALDIVGFTLASDGFQEIREGALRVYPTNSPTKFLHIVRAIFTASRLPWPDVVTAQDPFETGVAALAISRFVRKPLHIQVHTDFLSPAYARHSILNRIRVLMASIVLRKAARVRVVSERIKKSIVEEYRISTPITVLPIFTDISLMRLLSKDDALDVRFSSYDTKVLYVGRFESEKNPCLALRAFAQTAPPTTCLIMVGSGSELDILKRLARDLNVAERVFFEVGVTAIPYYTIADLVLVTSRYEGYGLVIVEALAAGKPVLSTDVGIAREAGAIIAPEEVYADELRKWFSQGPREGKLDSYPYRDFQEYVEKYCEDVAFTRTQ